MLNEIILMGRLTGDPELKETSSGAALVNFSLAVERDFASKDTGGRETDFIDCTAWRQKAEFISKYFHKGSMACVKGRLQIRSYEASDGTKRRASEVVVSDVYFCGGKNDSNKAESAQNRSGDATVNEFVELDDDEGIPF